MGEVLMQLQDDGTTCTHVVETLQSTMFVLCNSGQGDNAQHIGYLYAVYAVAKVTVYTAMNSCVLQGYMWLHSQVGSIHTTPELKLGVQSVHVERLHCQ